MVTTENPKAEKAAIELHPKYDHYDYPITSPEKKSGHAGHTTKEQDAQVHQLRVVLEQLDYKDRLDTLTLVRGSEGSAPPGEANDAGDQFQDEADGPA